MWPGNRPSEIAAFQKQGGQRCKIRLAFGAAGTADSTAEPTALDRDGLIFSSIK
jgi:hypothetical protein